MEFRGYYAPGISDYGNFDSNYYCNPYSEFLIKRTRFQPAFSSTVHTLENWRNTYGEDIHSKALQFSFDQFVVTDTLSGNMFANSHFNTTVYPWGGWPTGTTVAWVNHPLLDAGSMRMRWNGDGGSLGLTLSDRYAVTAGSHYLVSVSSAGAHSGTFSLWGFSSLSTTTFTFPQKFFNYSNTRKNYSFTYQSDVTDPLAYMGVGLSLPDSLVYVDNIKMYKVNVDRIDSTQKSKMFFNENNFTKNTSLNGITYKDLDGNFVTGSIALPPYSAKILIDDNFIPSKNLQLKVLIEGLYNSSLNKMVSDSATVYMREASSPFSIVDSSRAVLDSNGNGTFKFYNALNSNNSYLIVKHRNSLETWSSVSVSFISDQLSYDFTTSSSKAFGNNLRLKGSKYCIYSGEIVNDGEIEMSDVLQTFNASSNFSSGYALEDFNGDQNVDLEDLNLVHNNSTNFVRVLRP